MTPLFRFRTWSLGTKILALLFVAGSLPVACASWLAVRQTRAALVHEAHQTLASRADGLVATLDAFHRGYLNNVAQLARSPSIVRGCAGTDVDPARMTTVLQAFARSPGVAYVALASSDGRIVTASVPVPAGTDVSFRPYFQSAVRGETVVSDVFVPLPVVESTPLIAYSAPVLDDGGVIRCVAIVTVRVPDFDAAVRKANGFAGEGSFAVVLDSYGVRIAHSLRDEFIFHPAGRLAPAELAKMDQERRLVGPLRARLDQPIEQSGAFALARADHLTGADVTRHYAPANRRTNLMTARRLSTVPWTVFVLTPESTIESPVTATVRSISVAGAVLVVASLALGLLLVSQVLRPLRALRVAADRLGAGDVDVRVDEGPDEIGGLGARFNAMAQAIAEGRDQLEARVAQRTADLVSANRELEAQREELSAQGNELRAQQRELEARGDEVVRANRLKSEFLANMSHELRTPLNSIIGFADLVLDDGAATLDAVQKERLGHVLGSGRHLLGLINEILDLSKIEAGQVSLERESLEPRAVLEEAAALVRGAALKRRIQVSIEIRTNRRVFGDATRVRQILVNLLSNAVKFAPDGSVVVASADDSEAFVRFAVSDQGPGIEPELLSRLFEPFVQGESALVKSHHGTGLGLAISKRLVQQHGGAIDVDSSPGRGATFRFTIPVAVRSGPVADHGGERAPVGRNAVWVAPRPRSESDAKALIGSTVASAIATPEGAARRVVVVDDDPRVGVLVGSILEMAGFRVEVASTAADGIAMIRAELPAAAIIDLHLPDRSGVDVIDALAADPVTRALPLLVLTSVDLSIEEKRQLRQQVHAIMEKGDVVREELVLALESALRGGSSAPVETSPILVIDDHDLNRELARALLERAGYSVVLARDGDEGLLAARRAAPALVLLDLGMPGKDGFAVARELRADPSTREVPIVAVTAHAMRGDEERVMGAGMDGYLTKPVDRQALLELVDRLVPRQPR